jgi:predicted Na+-dependent transporter
MLLILLKASIAALIFAIGMTATTEDIVYLWRRPALLLKSIIAMYVVMPAVAVLMARTFDLPPRTELALVVLAICAGAPLLPKKLIKFGGDPSYVFSLIVTTSLLAIVTVPASLHFLAEIISFDTSAVTPSQVARIILKTFLLPLGVGMLFRLAVPALADRFGDPLLKIASAVMALCALAALAVGFRLVFEVGLPSLIAFAAFTLSAIVVGHLLGGPNRISLAIACASRHIGLALLIAANARGQHALALVVAYLLASAVVSIPYVRRITKHRPPA